MSGKRTKPLGRRDFAEQVQVTKASAREQLLDAVADDRVRAWLGRLLGVEEVESVVAPPAELTVKK